MDATDKSRPVPDKKHERCVCCREYTRVPVDMDIEYRAHYVEGAGQLCYDCYKKLYGPGGNGNL